MSTIIVPHHRTWITTGAIIGIGALTTAIALAANSASIAVLGGVCFGLLLVGTLVRWRFGVGLLLAIACIDGFIKHLQVSVLTYSLKDILLVATLLGLFVAIGSGLRIRHTDRHPAVWWLLGAYMAFLAIQMFNPSSSFVENLAGFRAYGLFAILLVVGAYYFNSVHRLSKAVVLVISGTTLIGLSGIAQYLAEDAWKAVSPALSNADLYRYATVSGVQLVYRVFGTTVDPGALGLACAVGIVFAAAYLPIATRHWKFAIGLAMATMAIALVLSGTRTAVVALLAGLLVVCALNLRTRMTRIYAVFPLALLSAATILAFALSPTAAERFFSPSARSLAVSSRLDTVGDVSKAAVYAPLGAGLGATGAGGYARTESQQRASLAVDNIYYSILYSTGFVGLLLFVSLQLTLLVITFQRTVAARLQPLYSLFAGAVGMQIVLLVAGFATQGAYAYAPLAQIYWLFAAAVFLPKEATASS